MTADPFQAIADLYRTFFMGGVAGNANSRDAGLFFNPDAPLKPIPIYTEQQATIFEAITEGLMINGISVFITTVDARAAQSQVRARDGGEKRAFDRIPLFFIVIENPKTNTTGVSWGLCAAAVDWWAPLLPESSLNEIVDDPAIRRVSITKNPPLQFSNGTLKANCRAYLVALEITGGFTSMPQRPGPPLVTEDGQAISTEDGQVLAS